MSQLSATGERPKLAFAVTHRTVLAIAIPMTLAYLSTPLLGIVDMAVIGRLGDPALLGGIAIGGIIFDLVFTTFNFLRSGTTGLTAQAFGARNEEEVRATLLRAFVIAAIGGLLVILLQAPLREIGLWFLGAVRRCRPQRAATLTSVSTVPLFSLPTMPCSAGSSASGAQEQGWCFSLF